VSHVVKNEVLCLLDTIGGADTGTLHTYPTQKSDAKSIGRRYGVVTKSKVFKFISLFCKRALQKEGSCLEETYQSRDHKIFVTFRVDYSLPTHHQVAGYAFRAHLSIS